MSTKREHPVLPSDKESEEKEKSPAYSVYGHAESFWQWELAIFWNLQTNLGMS
jgi:hypothetical protein